MLRISPRSFCGRIDFRFWLSSPTNIIQPYQLPGLSSIDDMQPIWPFPFTVSCLPLPHPPRDFVGAPRLPLLCVSPGHESLDLVEGAAPEESSGADTSDIAGRGGVHCFFFCSHGNIFCFLNSCVFPLTRCSSCLNYFDITRLLYPSALAFAILHRCSVFVSW